MASGSRRLRSRARLPAPTGLLDPQGGGQAEVPGRIGVGDGRVHHRRPPRRRRGPTQEGRHVRTLVTGGAGYIGSVVAAQLLDAGHEVIVLDNLSTGHRDAVPDGATLV